MEEVLNFRMRKVRPEDLLEGQQCLVRTTSVFNVEGRWLVDEEVGPYVYVWEPDA